MPSSPTLARQLAQDVLVRVARDAAFAERVLHAALERVQLEPRDRALVTELVYGTLRHQGWLDHCLEVHTRKPLTHLPLPVVSALRLGAYQLLCMGVPAHSAVHESVGLVRRYGRMTGLVNAVLRRLDKQRPAAEEPSTVAELAVQVNMPLWLLEAMVRRRGFAATLAWGRANNLPAAVPLRVNRRAATLQQIADALRQRGVAVQTPAWVPPGSEDCSLLVRRAGAVKQLPGFAEGWWTVQDVAAGAVTLLAAPRAGDVLLDTCSAPGGKATHAAELMNDSGLVLATDVHPGKTRLIGENAARLGLTCVHPVTLDARDSAALGALLAQHGHSHADQVIVDAPCSGLGTARRNPEVRQKRPTDCNELGALQAALLDSAAPWVRPGGVLIYAVCTVTDVEGPEQVQRFMACHPQFILEAPGPAWDGCVEDGCVRTWTDVHQADSFFAARLRRLV